MGVRAEITIGEPEKCFSQPRNLSDEKTRMFRTAVGREYGGAEPDVAAQRPHLIKLSVVILAEIDNCFSRK